MDDLIQKFNLPKYIKGRSFAEASKVIQKKFEGRNDPESTETKKELLGRLRSAQEYVKELQAYKQQASNPQAQQQAQMPPAQQAYGGSMSKEQNQRAYGGDYDSGEEEEIMNKDSGKGSGEAGKGDYGKALSGLVDMSQQAFGNTGVDMSGEEVAAKQSAGLATAGGAMSGAQAGSSFGPWGMAAGAVVGGVSGLIGANRYNKDAETQADNIQRQSNPYLQNQNFDGGELYGLNEYIRGAQKQYNRDSFDFGRAEEAKAKENLAPGPRLNEDGEIIPIEGVETPAAYKAPVTRETEGPKQDQELKEKGLKLGKYLRYAAPLSNIAQMLKKDEAETTRLGRLQSNYKEELVDEKGIENIVSRNQANNRNAIVSNSGGSGATALANLQANSIKSGESMSRARMAAMSQNAGERQNARADKARIAQVNMGQQDRETEINDMNRAAYENNKRDMMATVGTDLSAIGKEQLFKEFPELMGMSYDDRGEFIKMFKEFKEKKDKNKNNKK